jgi:hypothetical protein
MPRTSEEVRRRVAVAPWHTKVLDLERSLG